MFLNKSIEFLDVSFRVTSSGSIKCFEYGDVGQKCLVCPHRQPAEAGATPDMQPAGDTSGVRATEQAEDVLPRPEETHTPRGNTEIKTQGQTEAETQGQSGAETSNAAASTSSAASGSPEAANRAGMVVNSSQMNSEVEEMDSDSESESVSLPDSGKNTDLFI
ncbi:hypothetical protein LDENG_00239850 [Lucifuga dentata]|nr:hypothetical protein LDENG_00239850 [Lucifuga dentata]